jgi:hypothetical protein
MIIIVAPKDSALIQNNAQQSRNFPEIYGDSYVYDGNSYWKMEYNSSTGRFEGKPDNNPRLEAGENVFISGHAIEKGDTGNAEIGDESGGVSLNGIELWDKVVEPIIPDLYRGSFFVDACSSADFARGAFSVIETFKSQADINLESPAIYGRTGDVGYEIPRPGAEGVWTELMRAAI